MCGRYHPLPSVPDEYTVRPRQVQPRTLLWCLASFTCVVFAFLAGRFSSSPNASQQPYNLHNVRRVFTYNRTFSEPPSDQSNAAWASLFPSQNGFFRHPTIAPQRSAFSVFHQMHCLVSPPVSFNRTHLQCSLQDGIRHGYWTVFDAAQDGRGALDISTLPERSSPAHIQHCIDLLRNALMCQPDMTIERREDETKGVRGFGTEHVCKDWDELVRWTGEWETYNQKPRPKDGSGLEGDGSNSQRSG